MKWLSKGLYRFMDDCIGENYQALTTVSAIKRLSPLTFDKRTIISGVAVEVTTVVAAISEGNAAVIKIFSNVC